MKCEIVYFITFYVFEFLGCVRFVKVFMTKSISDCVWGIKED